MLLQTRGFVVAGPCPINWTKTKAVHYGGVQVRTITLLGSNSHMVQGKVREFPQVPTRAVSSIQSDLEHILSARKRERVVSLRLKLC